MSYVLKIENLVKDNGKVIAGNLINNLEHAELIIRHYYVKQDKTSEEKTYIPSELRKEDLAYIIERYVDWEEANINYLNLISGLKKAGEYPIDEKVRYKAYKRVREYWNNNNMGNQDGISFSIEIMFADQEEDIIEKRFGPNYSVQISYKKKWISDHLDYPTLLNNFIFLFKYVDLNYRCKFISNPKDLGIIERLIGVHGNNEYLVGIGFKSVNLQSSVQMLAYKNELLNHGIEIEALFKWFFEEYLKSEFKIENYTYCSPSAESSQLEKILVIISQIDAVLKQFKLYSEDGTIDREFYEFSSSINRISDAKSMIKKKYIYPNSDEIKTELYCIFSNQNALSYIEKSNNKYDTLINLLLNEKVKIKDFPACNSHYLKWLVDKGIIAEDENEYLYIEKSMYNVLSDLFVNGCISYSYCQKNEKKIVDEMLERGDLIAESSLFTRQEKDYLDYMLNTQQFNNGPEIRNKYAHGNFSIDEKTYESDYVELLKIMVLIVLKINEEYCLKYPISY